MRRPANPQIRRNSTISWVQYIAMVLAFIGLWQLLSNGFTVMHHWF